MHGLSMPVLMEAFFAFSPRNIENNTQQGLSIVKRAATEKISLGRRGEVRAPDGEPKAVEPWSGVVIT